MNELIVLAFFGGFAVGIFIACVIDDRRAKRQEKTNDELVESVIEHYKKRVRALEAYKDMLIADRDKYSAKVDAVLDALKVSHDK